MEYQVYQSLTKTEVNYNTISVCITQYNTVNSDTGTFKNSEEYGTNQLLVSKWLLAI